MVAQWLEASVEFQTGDVLQLYGILFGTLAALAIIAFVSAVKGRNK